MTVRISLKNSGTSFATRGRGEALREEVLAGVGEAESIVIDLSGVEHVSYSFADEFMAKLHVEHPGSVVIEGAGGTVQRTVADAIDRRAGIASSC